MQKRILCMALVITMIISTFAAFAAKFSDLEDSHWAYEDVELLSDLGIVDGYPDGTYRPSNEVTRYEYAKLLCESMEIEQVKGDSLFEDVKSTHWAYGYANAVEPFMTYYRGGATKEYRGDIAADREDIAASLVRALGWTNQPIAEETYAKFSDYTDITEELRDLVLIAYEKGLVNGYPDGTFGPSRPVTRAETAALLIRAMGDRAVRPNNNPLIPNGPPNPILVELLDEVSWQFDELQDETTSVEVTAAGDAVVVVFTFLLDIVDEALVKSLLEEKLNANQELFNAAVETLGSKGLEDAQYIVIYNDKNGKEIYSKVYK